MKDDTISRAATLSSLNGLTEIYLNNLPPTIYKEDAIKAVKALPSATDTNVATTDTISRMATLDALGERPVVWSDNDDYTLGERNQYDMDRLAIETVPSAQPTVSKTEIVGDTISRQAAIDLFEKYGAEDDAVALLESLPSAQTELENKIRAIGYTGREGRIYIGGRLFAVRELPQ